MRRRPRPPRVSAGLGGAAFALLVFGSGPARAEVVCYDESHYPSVVRLDRTETGLRAVLGGRLASITTRQTQAPALRYSTERGWEVDSPYACAGSGAWCGDRERPETTPIPPVLLSKTEALAIRPDMYDGAIEQKIGAWIEHDGAIWFGLQFYEGEGTSGVGGVGRYDPKRKQVVVRRPPVLRDASIDRIVHDGRRLWLATTYDHECSGDQPAHGLVRYDWGAMKPESFEGSDEGPCGFSVHDLALDAQALWVATDLGLSRWDRREEKWENFVPDPKATPPMRPTTCEALYTELLAKLPKEPTDWLIDYYSQLFDELERFRPRFLDGYVAAMPPAGWSCDELHFLGMRAANFAALETTVLAKRPLKGAEPLCALAGFAERTSPEPAFRDLLLKLLDDPEYERRDDVVFLLESIGADDKVADALARRIRTTPDPWYEAELLVRLFGRKSVPLLIAAIEDENRSAEDVRQIQLALMKATRIGFAPDGKQVDFSTGDPGYYPLAKMKDEDVRSTAGRWRSWWEEHKAEYSAASPAAAH